MAKNPKILSIVLAGGEGTRLMPLTRDRAKPAVPFGGVFRLIDFPLSNLVNSGYMQTVVLTQYKSHSLDRHISTVWRFSPLLGNYVSPVPAQQRLGKHWYLGSADAIYQTINIIEDVQPDIVVIVGADHVYRMDFQQMVQQHIESGAEFTVAGIRQPISQSNQFGVIEVDPEHPNMIKSFQEKPQTTTGLPDDPNSILASMGNYVANTDALFEALALDEKAEDTKHDMGGDIAPYFAARNEAGVYDFNSNEIPGATPTDHAYWRDVGTLKQFYDAHMDLISYVPEFNLYNTEWPIYTLSGNLPPAKFVHAGRDRLGHATDSIVSPGVIVSGGEVHHSVLSPNVRIHSWSQVVDSILFDGVTMLCLPRIRPSVSIPNMIWPVASPSRRKASPWCRRVPWSTTDVLPHTEQKRASRRREHAFSVPFFLDDAIQSNIIKICFTKTKIPQRTCSFAAESTYQQYQIDISLTFCQYFGRLSKLKPSAANCSRPSGVIFSMLQRGCHVQSIRNSSTRPASVLAHSSSIRSVNGHAGVVNVIVIMARPSSSISMPYTNPKSITSMPSSGSMT